MLMLALDEEPSVGVFQCWVRIKNCVKYPSGISPGYQSLIITAVTNIQMPGSDK
jgi:hypothetical protein